MAGKSVHGPDYRLQPFGPVQDHGDDGVVARIEHLNAIADLRRGQGIGAGHDQGGGGVAMEQGPVVPGQGELALAASDDDVTGPANVLDVVAQGYEGRGQFLPEQPGHAGHGEFPRAIFAPGSVEQCFHLTHRAVDTAERFQSPVFVLTDQFLADSYRDVPPFDLAHLPPVARPLTAVADPSGYERYAVTPDGISPRLLPGFTEATVVLDSDEHTPDGHITEDLHVRVTMQDKRLKKLAGLAKAAVPPDLYGDPDGATLLVCWGSTLGAAREAADRLTEAGKQAAVLHFSQVYPLVPATFLPVLAKAARTVME